MTHWQSQLFEVDAPPDAPVDAALAIANAIRSINPLLPPLFTLSHLAHETGVPYKYLRNTVARGKVDEQYSVFRIQKRAPSATIQYRWIAAPHPLLLKTQRWINTNILKNIAVHNAAFAYIKEGSAYKAACLHNQAKWLVKVDIRNFFESILETKICKVFETAGYQPLLAFELSRICTRIATPEMERALAPNGRVPNSLKGLKYSISAYNSFALGHLPQGAPTSPMLANIVAKEIDDEISSLAEKYKLRYSRYSDDIVLSTPSTQFGKEMCKEVVGKLYRILLSAGYQPNVEKTKISGPGSKMIVLGLLVDGKTPRLTSEFKSKLRMHLFYCRTRSPQQHAVKRKFASLLGLKNHLIGLISYAGTIDAAFASKCYAELNACSWPIFDSADFDSIIESTVKILR
ncbi:reverse transcriptase family protein [Massilia rubra]|uniref:RNA-directed DNA polymerase n=1 Tax=Massilia rubra TaxID=2607910 RepID=A0ABX0LE13_9BURK|nr:reverse transcriptase family protein [Massilia rubra]NHZ32873.1 RNA-directed DNA polymerase [Massilia rubra]